MCFLVRCCFALVLVLSSPCAGEIARAFLLPPVRQGPYGHNFFTGTGFIPGRTTAWVMESRPLHQMKEKARAEAEEALLAALEKGLKPLPERPPRKDFRGRPVKGPSGRFFLEDGWLCQAHQPWKVSSDSLMFLSGSLFNYNQWISRIAWVETPAGFSPPVVVAGPEPWFAMPERAGAGELVRVTGRALCAYWNGYRLVAVRHKPSGKVFRAERLLPRLTNQMAGEQDYVVYVRIPKECPPGPCEIFFHIGTCREYGWSRPVPVLVVPRAKQASQVVRRWRPQEGPSQVAQVMNRLLLEFAAAGGGVFLLPPGEYYLEKAVSVPSGVILRGVSRGGVKLIANGNFPAISMKSRSAAESLTLVQRSEKAVPLKVGDGKNRVSDVRIVQCRLVAVPGKQNDPHKYCGLVVVSPSQRILIRDTILDGRHHIGFFASTRRARVAYCKAGLQVEASFQECIIEFNEVRNIPGTFSFRLAGGDIRHNLVAWNKLVEPGKTSLPMGFVFDGSGAGANAEVVAASSSNVKIRGTRGTGG